MNVVFVLYILGSSVSPLLHKQTLGPIFNETSYSICLHSLLLHDSTNKRQYEFGCLFVTLYINQVTLHYFCSIFLFQAQKVKSKSVHNLLTYVGQLNNSLFFLIPHSSLSNFAKDACYNYVIGFPRVTFSSHKFNLFYTTTRLRDRKQTNPFMSLTEARGVSLLHSIDSLWEPPTLYPVNT